MGRRAHLPPVRARPRPLRRRKPGSCPKRGRTPFPSAVLARRSSARRRLAHSPPPRRRSKARPERDRHAALRDLLRDQGHDIRRADRGHRPRPVGQTRRQFRARGNPRHRQRNHRDQEYRYVDRRAGGLSTTSATTCSVMVRSSRCSRATRSPTSWSTAPARSTSKSAEKFRRTGIRFRDNPQLLNICQRIVSQVGRRVDESLADLRRALAGRLAR